MTIKKVIIRCHKLDGFSESWDKTSSVKKPSVSFTCFEAEKADYPESLVPFHQHPLYQKLDHETKTRILSAAWIWYNEKTEFLEELIVNPACQLIVTKRFFGACSNEVRRLISQIMVDEQYHAYMSIYPSIFTREKRDLEGLYFEYPHVIKRYRDIDNTHNDEGTKNILLLAFMVVAELSINGYLNLLSKNEDIQPLNKEITYNHQKDEARHSFIVKQVAKDIYINMSEEEKTLFSGFINEALIAFVKAEFLPWKIILEFIGVPFAEELIRFSEEKQNGAPLFRDVRVLQGFINELGFGHRVPYLEKLVG
ncbi:diiron oxygenase [Erwinia piriflorinigrans]|nr:diiron oxygenase [Erwinia piriflorinigrans]